MAERVGCVAEADSFDCQKILLIEDVLKGIKITGEDGKS